MYSLKVVVFSLSAAYAVVAANSAGNGKSHTHDASAYNSTDGAQMTEPMNMTANATTAGVNSTASTSPLPSASSSTTSMVPGDMSSGQCMCPAAPVCPAPNGNTDAASPAPGPASPAYTSPTGSVGSPSPNSGAPSTGAAAQPGMNSSYPGTNTNTSPAPAADTGNGTTSDATTFGKAHAAGIFAAGAVALLL